MPSTAGGDFVHHLAAKRGVRVVQSGVSMNTIWPRFCVTMPWMRFRVVCGLDVTMAIFWPTR